MRGEAFSDLGKWWIYRPSDTGRWTVSGPAQRNQDVRFYEFDSGAEALAAFAKGES